MDVEPLTTPTPVVSLTPGQIVTVFRSRLRPEAEDRYRPVAEQMDRLARSSPGWVDVKTFASDDGERVTVATFSDEAAQQAWANQADHLAAQAAGRGDFYSAYSIQVCRALRTSSFVRE